MPTDDGRYLCTYTSDRPGFYRLEVTSHGLHLSGNPFSVQVSTSFDLLVAGKRKNLCRDPYVTA